MVARALREREVPGSSPGSPTKNESWIAPRVTLGKVWPFALSAVAKYGTPCDEGLLGRRNLTLAYNAAQL